MRMRLRLLHRVVMTMKRMKSEVDFWYRQDVYFGFYRISRYSGYT